MNKKEEEGIFTRYNLKWVFFISIWTFIMSIIVSVITENLVTNLDIAAAFIVLIVIILIGIIFDIIGIAVTTAEEKPFHAMAANKVEEAKFAIKLVRNAGQVSNFCNDVIGDISGILSGAAGTTIIYKLMNRYSLVDGTMLTIIITSLIAAFTVGGKAFGKSIALFNYERIIYSIAKILNLIEKRLGIDIFPNKKKNKK
ncbi:hypothetical protein ACF3M2_16285 [Tissierella carlieri]|jgi:CBS domain containing-hemolysin-like protein|uniref:hypothetical protein n=1 Tax=Tissierella carlieri TaxID=689904 RepID=UPI0028037FD3|nr:hypothetical protein [uncultured Tissierella sp.]MDU5080015.1 hypothetical protein [Bacillota bacterium]